MTLTLSLREINEAKWVPWPRCRQQPFLDLFLPLSLNFSLFPTSSTGSWLLASCLSSPPNASSLFFDLRETHVVKRDSLRSTALAATDASDEKRAGTLTYRFHFSVFRQSVSLLRHPSIFDRACLFHIARHFRFFQLIPNGGGGKGERLSVSRDEFFARRLINCEYLNNSKVEYRRIAWRSEDCVPESRAQGKGA